MAKNNNKGFSLVEVIVAIAVFAILIVPLTSQLIGAIRTNETSKKKQYAIEKAEEIMEQFKVCDFSKDIRIPDGNSTGDYLFTLSNSEKKSVSLPNGKTVDYSIDTYKCNLSLGEEYEKYTCEVQVNSLAYAVLSGGYVWDSEKNTFKEDSKGNPVRASEATGDIRNLDNDQAAIISGATYLGQNSGVEGNSLDNKAFQYFQDAKLDILKKYDVYYSQYLSGADYFVNDSFNKYTDIKVEKKSGKYVVSCIVHYEDNTKLGIIKSAYAASGTNVYYPDTIYGKGVVYEKEYDMLPPIYLLYVPAVYNGAYCPVDNISVDTSGLAAGDKAKIYVFETAAEIDDKYKDIICKQFGVDDVEDLVYKNSKYTLNQKNVKVRANLAGGTLDNFDMFANFKIDQANSDIQVKSTDDDTSDNVYMYDIKVTLTDSDKKKTEVTGTRGKR